MDKIIPIPSLMELCMDCGKRKAEYLCDMPSNPKFFHTIQNGRRKLEIIRTCDRQICQRCAIEIAQNRHCCKKCASKIRGD